MDVKEAAGTRGPGDPKLVSEGEKAAGWREGEDIGVAWGTSALDETEEREVR